MHVAMCVHMYMLMCLSICINMHECGGFVYICVHVVICVYKYVCELANVLCMACVYMHGCLS